MGVDVWYDRFTLKLGDSLRESFDFGLANSKYGIVILSEIYFKKFWTNKELNGLFAKHEKGNSRFSLTTSTVNFAFLKGAGIFNNVQFQNGMDELSQ